jgi:hypothetical protein
LAQRLLYIGQVSEEHTMTKFLFPALIVVACAGTAYAMMRGTPADEGEAAVKLPVTASMAPEITPWLQAAATDLGHKAVKAYDGSVYINVGDDKISFFKDKNAMQMHVEFESKYRHSMADREPALKALEAKGQAIFEHALSMQARDASKQQMAARVTSTPEG